MIYYGSIVEYFAVSRLSVFWGESENLQRWCIGAASFSTENFFYGLWIVQLDTGEVLVWSPTIFRLCILWVYLWVLKYSSQYNFNFPFLETIERFCLIPTQDHWLMLCGRQDRLPLIPSYHWFSFQSNLSLAAPINKKFFSPSFLASFLEKGTTYLFFENLSDPVSLLAEPGDIQCHRITAILV